MRRDDLEEGLHRGLDRDHLAVYADELQRLGDPRGELITIDLHTEERGGSIALAERRRSLLATLLGPDLAAHPVVRSRYGFVDLIEPPGGSHESEEATAAAIDVVLSGLLGRYVREVSLVGTTEHVRDVLSTLAEQPRPFLTRLAIRGHSWLNRVDLPADLVERVAAAVPHLHTLEVSGRRVVPMVVFPTVQHLVATGYDAVAGLRSGPGAPVCFPLAGGIDLGVGWPPGSVELDGLLAAEQLPLVTRLDVVRCDQPVGAEPSHDVFRFLRTLSIAAQLEGLRVPPVRTDDQALHMQAAIDRMPRLAVLEVHGHYGPASRVLRHESAEIRLPPPGPDPAPPTLE